ncbi:MAG TPA: carboxypeptidase-like regulatory domain-containing protein [Bryobacteraceae bacterium]|jgi:hypothetical protein
MGRTKLLARIFALGGLGSLLLFAQATGSFSGRVINSVTGAGIEGVTFRVCAYSGGKIHCGDTHYQVVSDSSGAFHLSGLPDGQYVGLDVMAKGFWPAGRMDFTVSGDSRIEIPMTPFANVRGRVFDPEGKPAAGVAVKLGFLPEKITGENGDFLFEAVQPTAWLLSAAPTKAQAPSKDGTRIVTTYYPSVVDSAQAAKITVTGVDSSYDIRLQTAAARAISGVVIGADGKPARKARVTISRTEPGPVSVVRGQPNSPASQIEASPPVDAQEDGTFAFPPIVEGEWVLRASLLRDRVVYGGAAKVAVSARDADDIQNLEIQLVTPFDVEVTADWGDTPPAEIPPAFALADILPLEGQTDLMVAMHPTVEAGEPQRFHLAAGRYFIGEGRTFNAAAVPGFYAAAAMLDGRDVLGQVVELAGPASIKMIYKAGGGSVRGTVEKGANALVLLMADATPAARVGYSGKCDENGEFSIPDLPPGEYTAVAIEGSYGGSYAGDTLRPEFASALTRDGKRVKVEAGAPAQVELRLAVTQ